MARHRVFLWRAFNYYNLKKLITCMLLFVHLLNIGGQLALYEFLVYRSDKLFNEQISQNNYKIDDLVEVKIPVSMPTIQDWKEYVYISGQVQLKSHCYNYVKLKITRDTMYLMCIPTYVKTKLINQNIIDARRIADIPFNKKEHAPVGKMNNLIVYNCHIIQYRFLTPVAILNRLVNNTLSNITGTLIAVPGQPPEAINTLS